MGRCHALNVVSTTGTNDQGIQSAVIKAVQSQSESGRERYDMRMAKNLITTWNIDLEKHNIKFSW
jgi:hypothetical protein